MRFNNFISLRAVVFFTICANLALGQDKGLLPQSTFKYRPLTAAELGVKVPSMKTIPYKRNNSTRKHIAKSEWIKFKQNQSQSFNSVHLNYSSESGLDPSMQQFLKNKESSFSDLNRFKINSNEVKINKDVLKEHPDLPTLSKEEALKKVASQKNEQQIEKVKSLTDGGVAGIRDMLTVRSEKALQEMYDSLVEKGMHIPKEPEIARKEVSKEDLIKEVNNQFNATAGKKIDSTKNRYGGYKNKGDSLKGLKEKGQQDLSKLKLASIDKQDLRPLAGHIIDEKYLNKLDSIRKLNLVSEGYELKEKLISNKEKLSSLKEKQNFLDKSYFEGLLGIQQGQITLLQFSPALGYHLNDRISVGAGPNLTIIASVNSAKITANASARTFVKAEFFKRSCYLQAEDLLQPVKIERAGSLNQNILVGGGGLLPFTKSLAVNVALLYRVCSLGGDAPASSPWVFRIGISTIKSKSEK